MRRLRFAQKFALIGLVAIVPLGLVLYFFVAEVGKGENFAQTERDGVAMIQQAYAVMDGLLRIQTLNHSDTSRTGISRIYIRSHLESLTDAERTFGPRLGPDVNDDYALFSSTIGKHPESLDPQGLEVALAAGTNLVNSIANRSLIVLDPAGDSYYTAEACVVHLQRLLTSLGSIRQDLVTGRAGSLSEDRVRLDMSVSEIKNNLDMAISVSPGILGKVSESENGLRSSVRKLQAALSAKDQNRQLELDATTAVLDAASNFFDSASEELTQLLTQRAAEYSGRRTTVLGITAVCALVALYLFLAFYGDTRTELNRLCGGIKELATDPENASFKLTGQRDELGEVAQVLVTMTEALTQEQHSRRSLEAQLRESQKMQAIGVLAAGIAHDFNNLLAAILGNVELAAHELKMGQPAGQSIDEIRKASLRATALVEQIGSFARRGPRPRELVSLSAVVAEVSGLLHSSLPANVELRTELSPDTPAVLADSSQLHQVILNLCTNGWQAFEGRPGTVTIRTSSVRLAEQPGRIDPNTHDRDFVLLEVSDTGSGIPSEIRDRIFEPFFTTKSPGRGTGLGLSVVYGIIDDMGGSIQIESFEGEGTAVRVYLLSASQVEQPQAAEPTATEADMPPLNLRILYVDDDEALLILAKRTLGRQGIHLTTFTDPTDALVAFRESPREFDLVVTDQKMPGMTGCDLAQRMLAIRPDVPIILTTGYIDEKSRDEALASGIRQVIHKPNSMPELTAAVAELIRDAAGSG